MQRDALAEVNGPVVESLPVKVELEVVRQVNADVGTRCNGPERAAEFFVVHPDLHVFAVEEFVQAACVVEVEVSDNDLVDVFEFVARCFDGGFQFVLRLVAYAAEDVADLRAPYSWVVLCVLIV